MKIENITNLLNALTDYCRIVEREKEENSRASIKAGLKLRRALEKIGVNFFHLIDNVLRMDIVDEIEKEEATQK